MRKTISRVACILSVLTVSVCAHASEVVRTFPFQPIMKYSFEEGVGSTVYDSSGFGLSGTIGGTGTTRVSGHDGGSALSFNPASASSVSISNTVVTNQISVSAWVKLGTTTVKNKHAVSRHPGWFMSNNIVAGTLRFAVTTASEVTKDFGTLSDLGVSSWHHCVGVYDGAMIYTYLDGVLKDSGTQSGNMSLTGSTRIGNYWNGEASSVFTWNGLIDDVVIYSRALSVDEVRRLYFLGFKVK